MTRNRLLAALPAAILGLSIALPAQAKLDNDEVDVTLIVHCCPGNVFFEPVMFGAREAAEKFNVNLDIQNAEGDPQRQINIIETAIANRQDGVVPMISVEDAMIEVIAKAREAGMAVVSSNIDDADTARQGLRRPGLHRVRLHHRVEDDQRITASRKAITASRRSSSPTSSTPASATRASRRRWMRQASRAR